jgi:type VI secretion system protein
MAINLTIVKSPDGVVPAEASKTFDEKGGTLGRGTDNRWVLDDPERFLSSCHCQISFENGHYFLTDLSTNGTFVNSSAEPLGRNTKVALSDGDMFDVGDYRFSVSMWAVLPAAASPFDAPGNSNNTDLEESDFFGNGPQNSPFPQNAGSSDPFANNPLPAELYNPVPEDSDPLAALDKAGRLGPSDPFAANPIPHDFTGAGTYNAGQTNASSADIFSSNTYSDGADAMNQAADWPAPMPDNSLIPEDWDDDLPTGGGSNGEPTSLPLTDHSLLQGQRQEQCKEQRQEVQAQKNQSRQRSMPGRSSIEPKVQERKRKIPLEPQPESPQRPRPARPKPATGAHKPVMSKSASRTSTSASTTSASSSTGVMQRRRTVAAPPAGNASSGQASAVDTSVIDALGLGDFDLSDERIQEINAIVGELVRETVIGMMQSLRSRASIKNEFRMNVTTIQPIENNPLKFSANIDDALENMFIKQSNAYKKPVEAVREGFQVVAEHQVALLAGIRSAFKSMIECFDPEALEKQFERQLGGSLVPALGKVKNWNAYKEHYKSLADNMENSFQYLFGDEFVQAYEDQLIKLSKSRDKP